MRREGFELTVGQPQVLTREIDGTRARAGRAPGHRRARGLRRRRHPAARAAQGPPGADGQPRHRLGAHGVPRPGARPDRLPHRVPHRDARHRPAAPRLRPLGAVGGRAAHAADRRAGLRPPRAHGAVRAHEPPGARDAVRRPRRGGLRGHDRRRERARRRPRRQRHAREAPDEHPLLDRRRARAPRPPPHAVARPGARVPARGRVRRGRRPSSVRLRKVVLDKTDRVKVARRGAHRACRRGRPTTAYAIRR